MATKLADITLWQRNMASLIRSRVYERAAIVEAAGLFVVVGIQSDGSSSPALAKYSDRRRAEDALTVVAKLVEAGCSPDRN
jgi:pentatricopeptide repeat protein